MTGGENNNESTKVSALPEGFHGYVFGVVFLSAFQRTR